MYPCKCFDVLFGPCDRSNIAYNCIKYCSKEIYNKIPIHTILKYVKHKRHITLNSSNTVNSIWFTILIIYTLKWKKIYWCGLIPQINVCFITNTINPLTPSFIHV